MTLPSLLVNLMEFHSLKIITYLNENGEVDAFPCSSLNCLLDNLQPNGSAKEPVFIFK